jgi:hypothetical protein
MKRLIVSVATIAVALGFMSCGGDDVTAPVITIPGDALVIDLGDKDAALKDVTAEDKKDGDVTSYLEVVDGLDYVGVGSLTYSVKDKANNEQLQKRPVTVKTDKLFGSYFVTERGPDGDTTYNVTVEKSGVAVTQLIAKNFFSYDATFKGDGASTTLTMEPVEALVGQEKITITGTVTYKKGTSQYVLDQSKVKVTWADPTLEDDDYTLTFVLR